LPLYPKATVVEGDLGGEGHQARRGVQATPSTPEALVKRMCPIAAAVALAVLASCAARNDAGAPVEVFVTSSAPSPTDSSSGSTRPRATPATGTTRRGTTTEAPGTTKRRTLLQEECSDLNATIRFGFLDAGDEAGFLDRARTFVEWMERVKAVAPDDVDAQVNVLIKGVTNAKTIAEVDLFLGNPEFEKASNAMSRFLSQCAG
jgi:hypothetical protein